MIDQLLDDLHQSICKHGGQQEFLLDDFSEKYSNNGEDLIRSWLWKVPGFRRWRVTRLDAGNRLQVINSVAYPQYTNDQPLMGIDILWFGRNSKLVAVLDFQPLSQDPVYLDRYCSSLKLIRKNFPQLSNNQQMRSFDPNKYFSPWLIFCRGGLDELQESLPEAFNIFLDRYWDLKNISSNNYSKISVDEVERLQIDYDYYSMQRDPAHGLFASYFGKQWADRFLREFLFPANLFKDIN